MLDTYLPTKAIKLLPKPVPDLTKAQWEFLAERLDRPAPKEMQRRLQADLRLASKIKVQE